MGVMAESQQEDKLIIQTERFGELTANRSDLVRFALPMLGFEQATRFLLIQHKPDSPFLWLQSVDDGKLAFVLTQPKWFGLPYTVTIPDHAVEALNIQEAEDVEIYTLVSIPDDNPDRMTANLVGPVLIHRTTRLAAQIVLDNAKFSTKTPLLQLVQGDAQLQWLSQKTEKSDPEAISSVTS